MGVAITAAAQTTSTPAATPAAAATASAPATAPAAPAASAAVSAAPAAAAAAAAPETSMMDKKMISRGYKPAMAGNDRVYCRKEDQIGTHLPPKKVCLTAQQAEQAEHDAKEITEQMQRTNKPVGGT
ncbi:MAG TPA: hypothetical protein VGI91_11315 [Steroidobacteraceae bacterium]